MKFEYIVNDPRGDEISQKVDRSRCGLRVSIGEYEGNDIVQGQIWSAIRALDEISEWIRLTQMHTQAYAMWSDDEKANSPQPEASDEKR